MTQIIVITGASSGFGAFRVHIDPSQDGAEVVNSVADRVRAELLRRIGLADLLQPAA
jgi:NADP-dependent 3-hydroxy acid dehydrogenase YdfG